MKGNRDWSKGLTTETDERIKKHSEETKRKIRKSMTGKRLSEEAKQKISETRKKNRHKYKLSGMYGGKQSECEKAAEKVIKKHFSDKHKIIAQYEDSNWERSFIIDFAFINLKIAIEVNGDQHYKDDGNFTDYHLERRSILEKHGWVQVDIYWAEAFQEEKIVGLISKALKERRHISTDQTGFFLMKEVRRQKKEEEKRNKKEQIEKRQTEEIERIKGLVDTSKSDWYKQLLDDRHELRFSFQHTIRIFRKHGYEIYTRSYDAVSKSG